MRALALITAAAVMTSGCFAGRPNHRTAIAIDGALFAASLGTMIYNRNYLCPDDGCDNHNELIDLYAGAGLIGALIGAIATAVIVSRQDARAKAARPKAAAP